jgi:outer membrane protein TolC
VKHHTTTLRFLSLSVLLMLPIFLSSQAILHDYIQEAFARNPHVKEKESLLRKQQIAVQHAGKLFGPEVHFGTTYTVATGGRTVELPLGMLLNDVYSTLNDITDSDQFPQVRDESVTFLPHNFYDARFRLTQPILRPELKLNKMIREEEVTLAGLQILQSKRDLARDIKVTYFQWLQAVEGIQIIEQGLLLLAENKRITESLLRNGQALPSALLRIDAEIQHLGAQKQKAESDRDNAQMFFNFLLHRPADSEILQDSLVGIPDPLTNFEISQKEELQQIETGRRIQELAQTIEQKYHAPKLGLQVDIGSQAYVPDWGGYVLAGINLEVPIWDNRKSRLKQQEWIAQQEATTHQYAYSQEAFRVEGESISMKLASSIAIYHSYAALVESNQRLYTETLRRYKEGLANYIELLDAQTQVTEMQLEQNIAKYHAWIQHAHLERIATSMPLN